MEQVFFINPVAGKRDASAELVPRIQAAARQLQLPQPQIVVTQYAGQAREAARRYAASGTPVALYACGGDGTLNELVQGAAGSANVAVGCVPCGSGNDYVRNFGAAGQAPFLDFAAQLQAQPCRVDLLQTSLGIGIDICAAGLDAQVAYGIPKFRRLPGCGGTAAYTLSILQAMLSRFGHKLRVAIDGKEYTGTYMMAAICNGGYYGGGYQAAPYAAMDDGLLDIVLVKPISRIQVAGILAKYKAGRHMQDADTIVPEFRSFMTFYRARSVEMQVLDNRPIIATIDGECAPVMELTAEVLPSALNVLLPRPACGSAVIRGLYECPMQAKAK